MQTLIWDFIKSLSKDQYKQSKCSNSRNFQKDSYKLGSYGSFRLSNNFKYDNFETETSMVMSSYITNNFINFGKWYFSKFEIWVNC